MYLQLINLHFLQNLLSMNPFKVVLILLILRNELNEHFKCTESKFIIKALELTQKFLLNLFQFFSYLVAKYLSKFLTHFC